MLTIKANYAAIYLNYFARKYSRIHDRRVRVNHITLLQCLFDFILYVSVNSVSVMRGGSSCVEPVLSNE